jgi:hypothetical protein
LQDGNNEGVACAFLDRVFSKFGIPIETLINPHVKFCGKFQEFFEKTIFDHCIIS